MQRSFVLLLPFLGLGACGQPYAPLCALTGPEDTAGCPCGEPSDEEACNLDPKKACFYHGVTECRCESGGWHCYGDADMHATPPEDLASVD